MALRVVLLGQRRHELSGARLDAIVIPRYTVVLFPNTHPKKYRLRLRRSYGRLLIWWGPRCFAITPKGRK